MIWSWILSGLLFGLGAGYLFGRHDGGGQQNRLFGSIDDAEVAQWRQEAERTVTLRIERRLAQIESRAREQGRITNDTVEEMFCIGDRTASRYLAELARRGVLSRTGHGRGTYYEIIPD